MRNPTWSFKDRLASAALTMAKRFGAKVDRLELLGQCRRGGRGLCRQGRPAVRRLHLHRRSAGPLVLQMRAYGAMVVEGRPTRPTAGACRSLGVREFGWYPTSPFFGPVVGSNPYGMEGYKTIAYEIAEAFDWQPPDWCVLPVCYGDALYGMWKGFEELKALGWIDRMPRFVAAEVSGSLAAAMASGEAMPPEVPRNAPIDRDLDRRQPGHGAGARRAAAQSNGAAVTVGDDELRRWVVTLAAKEGIWPEAVVGRAASPPSSGCAPQGTIKPHERCVALLTAAA